MQEGLVILRYTGNRTGTFTVVGPVSKKQYQISSHPNRAVFAADARDAPWLLGLGDMTLEQQQPTEPVDMPITQNALNHAQPPIAPSLKEAT